MVVPTSQVLLTLHFLIRVFGLGIRTILRLVNQRVKQLLLPAVSASTAALKRAPVLVLTYKVALLPLFAHLVRVVLEVVWFSSEVLPVVRVDTLGLVVLVVVGTPLSFEVVHVELQSAVHLVD